jgi:hypothetical protein
MTIFELLFVAFLAAIVIGLFIAASRWVRGHRTGALAILRTLAISMAVYATIDIAVALASSREVHRVGETQCFDDWCLCVAGASRTPDGRVEVALQLSSRAKRITQGERGTVAYLLDRRGRRYDPVSDGATVSFDTPLQPGQTVTTVRLFRVPRDEPALEFVYEHEGFPIQLFIIGQAGGWIHGPPITLLDAR